MAQLSAISGPHAGAAFPLGTVTRVGRGLDMDIRLDDPTASKRHARFLCADGARYLLEDLASSNGTMLNGRRAATEWLKDGDEIRIGESTFVFAQSPGDYSRAMAPTKAHPRPGARRRESTSTVLSEPATERRTTVVSFDELARTKRLLSVATETIESISAGLDEDEIFERILDEMFRSLPETERASVVLRDADTGELVVRASRTASSEAGEMGELSVSATLRRHVMQERQAVLAADETAIHDRRPMPPAVMCAPLTRGGEALGFLSVESRSPAATYNQHGVGLLMAIAQCGAVALANARLHSRLLRQERIDRDLASARRIQHAFLPSESLRLPGYEIEEWYDTALEVGGDFFDVVELDAGRVLIAVGDVSGKGITAALMMAKIAGSLRFLARLDPSPEAVLRRVNEAALATPVDTFLTALVMLIDCSEHSITAASGGHPWPLVRRGNGETHRLEFDNGFPVGIVAEAEFPESFFAIEPGSVVCAFSDGVTDAMDSSGRLFGEDRLLRAIAGSQGSAAGVLRGVRTAVDAYCGEAPRSDDCTLVCVARTGQASGAMAAQATGGGR